MLQLNCFKQIELYNFAFFFVLYNIAKKLFLKKITFLNREKIVNQIANSDKIYQVKDYYKLDNLAFSPKKELMFKPYFFWQMTRENEISWTELCSSRIKF